MEIASKFEPREVEDRIYKHWTDLGIFHSEPNEKEPFTIVIPPPNVTGVLHMGHMLNNTIQDILIRRARLKGKNACWVPGTDHASIATEAKVVNLLAEQKIRKEDIGRDKFLEHAWEWKEKHDGIIFSQLKKLGTSCDWQRSHFTMDDDLYPAVINTFIKLHNEGLIYRGARMINWDPKAQTALSDEEVIRKEVRSKLYHLKYQLKDGGHITIATTRPETILGDTAICVHPEDDRYKHLKGKKAIVPLVGREIPIIQDAYVDMEFGTGALKVTPAHDINDYELGIKHGLEVVDTLNADGTMSEAAQLYVGEDRFKVRKMIAKELEEKGQIEKIDEITNNVGYSERNPDTVVEPRISTQWFLKMEELVKPALKAVEDDDIQIHPPHFKKVYKHWLDNIKDWCISRQLWWGHRIPAWYGPDGKYVIAATKEEAVIAYEKEHGPQTSDLELRQDPDVLDTWFSSWLWPFSVFGWKGDKEADAANKDLNYYCPTDVLVTGHDIIFFWVARMVMAGYHFMDQKPFKHVYFTGMVRDKQGRKMSKSLGNSPDALKLMEDFGSDGVRVGIMLSAPAGNDLHFDEALCLQGRNFANKIWNAFRLIKGWEVSSGEQDRLNSLAVEWFEARFQQYLKEVEVHFERFEISAALMMTYKMVWDDFCSWYLEMIKPVYGQPIDQITYDRTIKILSELMKVLHPFMPFITEEIWQKLEDGRQEDSVGTKTWPQISNYIDDTLIAMKYTQDIVTNVRQIRAENGISNKEELELITSNAVEFHQSIIKKLGLVHLNLNTDKPENAKTFIVEKQEFYIPLITELNVDEEYKRITNEITYIQGFLKSIDGKLSNEKFVNNAPEKVIEMERKKKADAEEKKALLEKQLEALKS